MKSLALPKGLNADDEKKPYPPDMESTYQDPSEPSAFWIQSLINDVDTDVKGDDFSTYLDAEARNE